MEVYKTICNCGNELIIEYEINEEKTITCNSCNKNIRFISKAEGIYLYWV